MTGVGTIALDTKQIGFRVEPKLVMTTEGQGRANEPVGFGIPVMIEGPWGAPKIYPDMQGILDNPDAAYAKLKEMGKGLFGPNSGGLGAALGGLLRRQVPGRTTRAAGSPTGIGAAIKGLLGGQRAAGNRARRAGKAPAAAQGTGRPGDLLSGPLGETIGNLLQQGLERGMGQGQGQGGAAQGGAGQGGRSSRRAAAEQPAQHSGSGPAGRSRACGAGRADGAE